MTGTDCPEVRSLKMRGNMPKNRSTQRQAGRSATIDLSGARSLSRFTSASARMAANLGKLSGSPANASTASGLAVMTVLTAVGIATIW